MNDTSEPVPQSQAHSDKALEDLRAQFVVLRQGIEDWQKHIEKNLPPDYTKYFELLVEGFEEVGDKVEALAEKTDAQQKVPTNAINDVVAAGDKMVRDVHSELSRAVGIAERDRLTLQNLIGTAWTKTQTRKVLIWTGASSAFFGMLFAFVLFYAAPFGLDGQIAAAIMGQDRWNAGAALMQAGNPDGWRLMVQDANLASANRTKVDACRAAAAKSKKDESCTITVAPMVNP
jgi:hypothetical protein